MSKKIIITILLSLMIILSFSTIIYAKIFTKNDVIEILDEANYYEVTYDNLTKKLNESLPNDELEYIYKDYVTQEQIKKDILILLENYGNNVYDYKEVKNPFHQNVIDKLSNYDKNSENVISLANDLANIYANDIFPTKQLHTISEKLPFKEISENVAVLTLLISILTLLICIFLTKQVYIYNAMLVSGILFIIPTIFIKINNFISNLYYYNISFSVFLKNYFYLIVDNYLKIGVILVILALIGIILSNVYNKNIDLNK